MATDPTKIVVPQMARLWLGAVGVVAPDGPTVAMPTGWRDVGLFTPDSLKWSTNPNFGSVTSHQSAYPTRRFQISEEANVEVDLQEWSSANLIAVYGGGTVVTVSPQGGGTTYYTFTPPAVGGRTNVAACLEIIDGTRHLRRMIPVAMQIQGVSQSFSRTSESVLPLRLAVIGSDAAAPWYDISDFLAPAA
jgi:hypothetical protein